MEVAGRAPPPPRPPRTQPTREVRK
jgi:hypothetical protein